MRLPDVTPGMPSRLPEEPGSAGARSLARNATGVPQSSHQLGQGVGPRTSIGQATDRFHVRCERVATGRTLLLNTRQLRTRILTYDLTLLG